MLKILHVLAATIAQRHARSYERNAADDEDLARKRGVITRLGERTVRGLLLGSGGLRGCLGNLGLSLRLGLGMILVVLGLCGCQGCLGIVKLCKRGGIGVVGIGQLGIGVDLGLPQTRLGVNGGLIL